jgi:hypothetical protein
MGRPLNKKYFGNRNIGVGGNQVDGNNSNNQNYADDRIGGEGVASYGTIVAGSGWTATPTVTFSAPNISGGVNVAGTAHYKALSLAVVSKGSGYEYYDEILLPGGIVAYATQITAVSVALVNAGDHYNNNDILEFQTGQFGTDYVTIRVTTVGGASDSPAASLTIVSGGRRPTQKPTGTLSYQNSLGGTGITFTLDWGVYSAGVQAAGDYTTFPSNPVTDPAHGATFNVTSGLLSVAVTQRGSGYTTPADAAISFSGSTGAAATAVLTVDSGAVGSATNQENAIIAYAYQDGERRIADIVKQTGTKRYVCVTNAGGIAGSGKEDETVYGYLVDHDANAPYQIDIGATDTNGNTYYVTKLTAHKATLTRRIQGTGEPRTYSATGYIDNNTSGGNGPGETFHLMSIGGYVGPLDGLFNATVTWTASGGGTTTIDSYLGPGDGTCYYVPGANVLLGDINNLVNFSITTTGTPAEWLFNDGDRVEWRFNDIGDLNPGQVRIDNA